MVYTPINFADKFNLFSEQWSPKIIAQINDYQFKIAKIEGEFVWHSHPETDEAFIVIAGEMQIAFDDGRVNLKAGEMFVVPKGIAHKPIATRECHILMVEPLGTMNTGDTESEQTIAQVPWI